jgi:intracellular septation protein
MQLLSEYLPLAAFAIAYFIGGIYTATATLMIAMTLSVVALRLRNGRFPPLLTASTVLVLLFGAATLFLRDARFLQWKPSVFLWLLSAAFLGSAFIGREPLAQRLMQPALGATGIARSDWQKVNLAWVLFGIVAGLANILIAYHTSLATWVKVKVFGLTAVMFIFLVAQAMWLNGRAPRADAPSAGP